MSDIAISVRGVGKQYRIGSKEKQVDTFFGAVKNMVTAPFRNYKQIRNLTRKNANDETLFWALKDINFEVKRGEVLGIIGHNGAGKSTLLKILSRVTDPTDGEIMINGRVSSLLEVGTGFHPELTGRENVYMNGTILGMTKKEIDRKFDEIVGFSGVEKYIDTPVKWYSSGMKVRLAFSVAANLDPEILIIDEVLAVGDFEFQQKCIGKMENVAVAGRTILFVSHNLSSVRSLCPRSMLLNDGRITMDGPTVEVIDTYLSQGRDVRQTGEIPLDFKRVYNSGEGFFKKIKLITAGQSKNELLFLEDFKAEILFESKGSLDNVNLSVIIGDTAGSYVAFVETQYANGKLSFEKGDYLIKIPVKNCLMPGNYTINLASSHTRNGKTIDHVERVLDFKVLEAGYKKGINYRWTQVYGNTYLEVDEIEVKKMDDEIARP